MTPAEQLKEIRQRLMPMIEEQMNCFRGEILPQLKAAGIEVAAYQSLTQHEKADLGRYFMEKVFPVLTPLAVDRSHPFPFISPLSLNLGLVVEAPAEPSPAEPSKFALEPRFVRIKVPSVVPRLVPIGLSPARVVLLEDLIEANIGALFPGLLPGACHRFRVTRDADIEIRDEEARDLLSLIQQELRQRRFGTPVRLEVSSAMPEEMIRYLTESLDLQPEDVYAVDGPLALSDFMAF